jgi:uncharacterized protein YciI
LIGQAASTGKLSGFGGFVASSKERSPILAAMRASWGTATFNWSNHAELVTRGVFAVDRRLVKPWPASDGARCEAAHLLTIHAASLE